VERVVHRARRSRSHDSQNPAVTVARALTDTFAGIHPADLPACIVAQDAGAATLTILLRWLVASQPRSAEHVIVPGYGLPTS
jgi:glycerol uptake facilitator-like aquaporin